MGWTAGLTDRSVQIKCKLAIFYARVIYLFVEIDGNCAAVKLIEGVLCLTPVKV